MSVESERAGSGRACGRLMAEAPGLFHAPPRSVRVEIVGSEVVPLVATEAEHLRRATGSLAWRVTRRWYRDGALMLGEVDTIPLAGYAAVPAHLVSLSELVRATGSPPAQWEKVALDVVAAEAWAAELCAVDLWTPLLSVDLLGVGGSGRLLYHAVQLHPPGEFQACILFSRAACEGRGWL